MADKLDLTIKQLFTRMKKQNPESSSCPNDEILVAYREGVLGQDEIESIENHLSTCNRCTDNLIAFSQAQSSYSTEVRNHATKDMIKGAKNLVRSQEISDFWEKLSSWFTVFKPIPVMVAASVFLVFVIFGIYSQIDMEAPTSIKLNIIARMGSDITTRGSDQYKEKEIQDGGVLHSGDMIKIKFRVDKEVFVYLISLDSKANITKVYPLSDTDPPRKVSPDSIYLFPEKDNWLRLDDNTGQETLYLLASPSPIEDIDQGIEQLKESGVDKITKVFPGVEIQTFSFRHE